MSSPFWAAFAPSHALLGPRTHRLTLIKETSAICTKCAWHILALRYSVIITRCSMSWSACSSTFCRDSGYFEGFERFVRFRMVLQTGRIVQSIAQLRRRWRRKSIKNRLFCICLANPGNKFDTTIVEAVNAPMPDRSQWEPEPWQEKMDVASCNRRPGKGKCLSWIHHCTDIRYIEHSLI